MISFRTLLFIAFVCFVLADVHTDAKFVNTDPNEGRVHDRPDTTPPPVKKSWFSRVSDKIKSIKENLKDPAMKIGNMISKVKTFVSRQVKKVFAKKVNFKFVETNGEFEYVLKIEIPFKKEDVALAIHTIDGRDVIILSGRYREKETDLNYKTFEKEYIIPCKIMKGSAVAAMGDGVLTIKLPKVMEKDKVLVAIQ
jgi:HSP20 family molecular chaperone IbpA